MGERRAKVRGKGRAIEGELLQITKEFFARRAQKNFTTAFHNKRRSHDAGDGFLRIIEFCAGRFLSFYDSRDRRRRLS